MPIFSQFGEIGWQRLFNIARILQTAALKHYFYTVYSKHRCSIITKEHKNLFKIKIHVLADQRVTIRLVKRLFLYGENTILPISVPGL